ncbi:MAG: serine/threonine protein kinase, partial [Gemmatimonadetes bacterium]|nr:serine/threonine protein kinase [Gemmatimonadota bacterium]
MEHEERLKAALADRYQVEREIGSGGMATVYLAQDLKHDREVAVKVLKPQLAQGIGSDRFLLEINTAANLTHPHIVPVYDSGEAEGFLYYVMPYLEGESLRARLDREGQLSLEAALEITREVAEALAYAHGEGVVHRDVKPENILLTGEHALLADFGIAQALAKTGSVRLTETGVSVGTPAYMSPEQASGEGAVDGRSDQYALGCVLYEMLGGQPPFTGSTGASVIRQHLATDPQSLLIFRPGLPEHVAVTVKRLLAKTPADRFEKVGDLKLALSSLPADTPVPWGSGGWG